MSHNFKPNEDQRKAIEFGIDTPLKVVAGAGTGKTEVLARRFVRIVEKNKISPFRVLALTFTKKAAAEMQNRITKELLRRKLISRSERPLLLWIGNFHSICHRLLRQNALVAGVDPSFVAIDEAEQHRILAESINDFLNKKLGVYADPDTFEELMIERIERFTRTMLRVINRLKANFIEAENPKTVIAVRLREQYRKIEENLNATIANPKIHRNTRGAAERRLESLAAQGAHEHLLFDAAHEIYTAYQGRLSDQNLLDFNDLISCAYRLAKADRSVRERFGYILVDEFQDTDTGQYMLLKELSDNFRNVTVVCDRKQCIYEWRDARIRNIDEFPGDTIHLRENYRSYGEILDSANSFIQRSMPEEMPLTPALEGGHGRAGKAQVKMFRAADQEEEAEYIAYEILNLLKNDYEPGQIAVLMRSVRASRAYEDAFRSHKIPYMTLGGCGFYDFSEAKDLISFLRLISNPFDNLSMVRILQGPLVGMSDATLYELCRSNNHTDASIYEIIKRSPDRIGDLHSESYERLQGFISTTEYLVRAQWSLTVGELISEVLNRTGYLKYLASLEGVRGARFSNVSLLYKKAALFEERNPGSTLEDFLAYLDNAMTGEAGTTDAGSGSDAIQIMTVHQAKGLEFPVVFIVNLKSGAFPLKYRSDSYGYEEDFGLFARKLPDGIDIVRYKGGYGINIEESLRARQYMEENRIMYVAMTRARDLLSLTASESKEGKGDDFLQYIEDVARESDNKAAEIAEFPVLSPTPSEDELKPCHVAGLEEIKEMTSKVINRILCSSATPIISDVSKSVVLSYSRLAMFRHCPMKYALRYVYDLPLSPHEESLEESHQTATAFALGNLLHKALMLYHRRKKSEEQPNALDILETIAGDAPRGTLQSANKIMQKYLQTSLAHIDTLYEEQEFHWNIESDSCHILFEGKIDRIHRDGDALKIIDYKTAMPDAERHKLQLGIYKLAAESVLGEQGICASNFYLSSCEEVNYAFTKDELKGILEDIIRDALRISKRDFMLEEIHLSEKTRDCASCGYSHSCPQNRDKSSTNTLPMIN